MPKRRHARLTAALLLMLTALAAQAQPRPAEIAAGADLVAVAVVEQVDYQKTRDFPSSGSAFLRILIPYRGTEQGAWIEVKEKGLGDEKCYYPEPNPFAFEGARFLVILRKDPTADVYRGVTPGCRIPVLVTERNRYAVRFPVDGLALPEDVDPDDVVEQFEFNDPGALVDAGDFTSMQIEELETEYFAVPVESGPLAPNTGLYRYTRGIDLSTFRRMLELGRN